jgi:hypothetical protein
MLSVRLVVLLRMGLAARYWGGGWGMGAHST